MAVLYGRYYELTLYSSSSSEYLTIKSPTQVQFRVAYYPGRGSIKGTAEITIYGLNMASLDQIISKYDRVKLIAGYLTGYDTIFDGTVFTPSKGKAGAEQYLLLFCSTMGKDETAVRINTTWGQGTRVCDIVKEIASSIGIPVTFLPAIDTPDNTFWPDLGRVRTLSVSDTAYGALDELGRSFDFIVYRLVDKILIIPGSEVGSGTSHEVSVNTGMEGSPVFTSGPTVNVVMRMNTKILPGDEIVVRSRYNIVSAQGANFVDQTQFTQTRDGKYFASSIFHVGDFYGDTWSTSIQGYSRGVDWNPITKGDDYG
ncbi:hypothetical protein [Pseudomonas sp. dw_358]|uniref:hypothetical protein n=1 Tax=Pseudomonas sp. dw_358 TaxID=2720083 RepID=UPI001BD2E972|nr:hypothetical protein [Pseudomonas sp. dw_358]